MTPWKSARGHRDRRAEVREALLASPDGMTRTEIAKALGVPLKVIHRIVRITPGVYIDRWLRPGPVRVTPVFCADKFTEDAPRPD